MPGVSPQRCTKVCEHAIVEVAHFGIYSSRVAIARPGIEKLLTAVGLEGCHININSVMVLSSRHCFQTNRSPDCFSGSGKDGGGGDFGCREKHIRMLCDLHFCSSWGALVELWIHSQLFLKRHSWLAPRIPCEDTSSTGSLVWFFFFFSFFFLVSSP